MSDEKKIEEMQASFTQLVRAMKTLCDAVSQAVSAAESLEQVFAQLKRCSLCGHLQHGLLMCGEEYDVPTTIGWRNAIVRYRCGCEGNRIQFGVRA